MEIEAALRRALRRVRSLGVITGAGVSAESGIPTYRGRGGLYDDPRTGERTVEALSAHTLAQDPARTWSVVTELARRSLVATPNAAHEALVELERRLKRFVLLTQNVDGLHQQAGSVNLIDIHGHVLDARCDGCGTRRRLEAAELEPTCGVPRCRRCEHSLRPDAVLFGETLPRQKVARIEQEFYREPLDAIWLVGTSASFSYILDPLLYTGQCGGVVVEVNPEPVLPPSMGFVVREKATRALPALARWVGRSDEA